MDVLLVVLVLAGVSGSYLYGYVRGLRHGREDAEVEEFKRLMDHAERRQYERRQRELLEQYAGLTPPDAVNRT